MLLFDFIEFQLHLGRELHVHDFRKTLNQFVRNHATQQRRVKAPTLLHHILSVLNCLNDAGVCAGAADPQALHLLHQRRFRIARRRLREMLRRINVNRENPRLFCQFRQQLIFRADAGNFHKSVENQLAPTGTEDRIATGRGRIQFHRGLVKLCRRHLAGDEAAPDQLIQLVFIRPQLLRCFTGRKFCIGWPNRFVCFLRLLLLDE